MTTHYFNGLVVELPDDFETRTITFKWGELRPAMVKELAEALWDYNPKDPRIAELNELYALIMGGDE